MGRREDNERTTVLVVGGMHSGSCVSRIEQVLRARQGVETAGVNLLTRLATVRHNDSIRPMDLADAVTAAGFQATLANPGNDARGYVSFGDTIDVIAGRKSRFVAGAIFTLLILLVNQFWLTDDKVVLLFLLATPVQITVGWEYYRGCIRALRRLSFNMDTLVVLGSSAAYFQGFLCFIGHVSRDSDLARDPQFHAAAMILTVMSLGKWLEARAHESTSLMWGSLIEMAPKEACVLRDGREQIIPTGVVALGDIVLVRPHEKIPVDGEVLEGSTEVNEALITGESFPVPKVKGDRVIVASVNGSGFIRVRAIGVGADSTIAQIARMVSDAQAHKVGVEKLADRVSAIVVPLSVVIATAAFVLWYFGPAAAHGLIVKGVLSRSFFSEDHIWLDFLLQEWPLASALKPAIAVLIAACPPALGLATSTAVIVATGRGMRHGILIKGGEAIESAGRITDVVFDKTGTLTEGSFKAQEVLTAPNVDSDEVLILAGSLEACSQHALAKGVVKEAKKGPLPLRKVEDFEAVPGSGLKGTVDHKIYILGSRALIAENGCNFNTSGDLEQRAAKAESAGATLIYLAVADAQSLLLLGAIVMTDRIKDSAAAALEDLHALGLRTHLLSGDNPAAAQAVGKHCGLQDSEIHALMKPEDKVDFTQQLKAKGHFVAIVGDGINDAPALAAADVGFAIGTGTDIALESGQIVLASSDVRGVPRAIRLARAAARVIHFNILWAFLFNLGVMLPLVIVNKLDPSMGAGIMAFSSILVVMNSLRLMYKPV